MRLSELLSVMPAEAKVSISIITPTGGVKKGEIMYVVDAVELNRMYLSDKVLNIEARYDWREYRLHNVMLIYTGILVSTLWRYTDE